jgi:transposase
MSTAAVSNAQDIREWRRMRAWELHQEGWSGKDIAAALAVSRGAVSGWLKRARAGGMAALRRRPAPGPTPKLTTEQRTQLPDILATGAEAYGFIGDIWTTTRVATVIKRIFGISYHPAHVSRLVRQEGLSLQKPIRRASQRDEAQIAAWRAERWPALQAKPTTTTGRSCSSMRRVSICCPLSPGRMPHAARRQCCAPRSRATTSP